jgi:hypothetical protein
MDPVTFWRTDMMSRSVVLFALISFVAGALCAEGPADKKDLFAKDEAGDWIRYVSTNAKAPTATRLTLVKKSDEQLSFELVHESSPVKPFAFNCKPADAAAVLYLLRGYNSTAQMKETKRESEKVKIGKKTYECTCISYTVTRAVRGAPDDTVPCKAKVWICSDVPMGGIVKWESQTYTLEVDGTKAHIKHIDGAAELLDFGKAGEKK